MIDFTFDIQRFAEDSKDFTKSDTFTVNGTTYSITLEGPSPKATVYWNDAGNISLTVDSGTVTSIRNGSDYPAITLNNSGSGTFNPAEGQKVTLDSTGRIFSYLRAKSTSSVSITSAFDITLNLTPSSIQTGTEISFGEDFKTTIFASITNSRWSVSNKGVIASGNLSTSLASEIFYDNKTYKLTKGASNFTCSATDLTLNLSDIENNFTSTYKDDKNNDVTVSYSSNKSKKLLSATKTYTRNGREYSSDWVWTATYPTDNKFTAKNLGLDTDTKLSQVLTVNNGNLVISNDFFDAMEGASALLVDVSDKSIYYAILDKPIDNKNCVLRKDTNTSGPTTAITINYGLPVDIDKGFEGVPITVENFSTTFTSTDTTKNFTVSSVTGGVYVDGSTAVSLRNGTIKTDDASQTITAGGYKVFGYDDNTSVNDGLFVAVSSEKATVGDIDIGETFSVRTASGSSDGYTRLNAGLLQLNGTTDNKYMLYIGGSDTDDGGAVRVDLANLTDSSNLVSLVSPSNGGVFEIGSTHTYSAAVVDDVTNPSEIYASLNAANGSYTLSTIGNGDATAFQAAGTISLTGGTSTTIHKSLVSGATNIVSSTDATFKVDPTEVSGDDTFTVNLKTTDSATTIAGATAITLISGTISAQKGQTITLGDVKFTSTNNNMTVTYNDSTATVTGKEDDAFTLTVGETTKTYTVNEDSGTAMTFTIDSSGNVTVNGLDSLNDSFTYDGVNYSVKSVGFIGNSLSSHSLWSANDSHSLTNGSVAVNSLGTSKNWSTLVALSSSAKSVTIPPSNFNPPSILIDDTFSDIFGTLTGGANSSYSLSGSSDNKLSSISLLSGVNALSLGGGNITNVSIVSSRSSLTVTEDDSTAGYQVTLSGGATSLVGASKASLISGSLTTDKNSLTVSVWNKGIVASNPITLVAGNSSQNSSITGVDPNDVFSVDGTAYSLSAVGLVSNSKLLNSVKPAFGLSELDTNNTSNWHDMIAPTNNTLTISETTPEAFVVDNTNNPKSLFAELTSQSGGHSMYAASGYTPWSDTYTINIDNTTVSLSGGLLSGGFANKTITGASSEAAFTTDSNRFVVQDSVGGAIITGANNITQTAGLVFSSVTSQSIAVNSSGSIVSYGGSGDGLAVSVSGSTATISGLDTNEIFTVNDTAYTITALGLVKDNSFWRASATESVTSVALTDLVDSDNWMGIVSVTSAGGILNIPPSDTSAGEWIVIDSNNRYGLLTKTGDNYSLSTAGSTASFLDRYTINVTNTTVTLSSGFTGKNITGENSDAAFTADSLSGDVFIVTDATAGANITGAKKINQTAGTIALSTANQSIVAGSHSITGAANQTITTYVNRTNVTIGALNIGDSFTVDNDKTYTLLNNGRLQRSDNLLWSGATIASSIALNSLSASTWNGLIKTDSSGNLTINSDAVAVFNNSIPSSAAYVVNQDDLTTIYGTLTKSGDDYTLSTTGKTGDSLSSVTVDLSKVIFTSDFLNTSIHAGETDFMATAAPSSKGFTVNYDSDSNEVSVGTATAVSLLSGALAISDSSQIVTTNAKTFQATSGSFTVNYDNANDLASVSGIDTTSESVKVNGTTYTLLDGDGFGIETTGDGSSANTTVTGLNTNDKFRIADSTGSYFEFTYTEAGLVRTKQNSSTISYILSTLTPTSNQLTLADLMTTNNDGIWLGLVEVSSDKVITLDGKLTNSAFLVDSIDTPTKNYGQITYDSDAKTYTLSKFTATGTIAEGTPSLISVGSGVKATIDSDFSTIPLTANNATAITVNIVNGTSYTISGTINRVDLQNKTFTPAVGYSFTVDDTAYLMTGAGLTKTASNQIWTEDISPQSYVLPTETSGTWSNIVKLTSAGVLDFSSVTVAASNNVVVTSDLSARRATITSTNNLYELSSTDSKNPIATVKLADETPIDINFATTVQTGSGTYTVNGKAYTTTSGITIDATATDSTLNTGTVTLDKDKAAVTATNDSNSISVTDDNVSITATATNGVWNSLGSLENGDTFTIGDIKYKVFGTTLAKLDSSGEVDTIYNGTITNNSLSYDNIINGEYDEIISLNANSELDLRKTYSIDTKAIVVGVDNNGNIDPTKRIAQLAYNDDKTGYVLSAVTGGDIDSLKAVLLDATFKVFSTTLGTTVSTVGVETFTINGNSFNAQNALTIATESGNAYLTNGKVKLEENATINTRRTEDSTTISETITNTSGSLTVEVSNNDTVTIGDLNSSESFTYGNSTYTMSSIGLVTGNTLNPNAATNNSITTAELVGDNWKTMWQTTDGALVINNSVPAEAYAVYFDETNPAAAVNYGTLTKTDGVYSFTQTTALASITVDGVKVELPSDCSQIPITASGAEFTVTASDKFTVNATSTLPSISGVSAITLTSGTIPATTDIPITALGNVITRTAGDGLTVQVSGSAVTVGALNTGDKFTVGATSYEMTAAGLLDTTNQKLLAEVTTSYTLGSDFTPIIAADDTTLDLSNRTEAAHVYDSLTSPTKKLAELTVADGVLTLTKTADGIKTIQLARNAALEIDFVALVEASGTTKINGATYAGTTALTIDTTAESSTLQSGTITLSTANPSAQATNDTSALKVESGTISAQATGGKFTTISGLATGESFSFGGKTYTQTAIGLTDGTSLNTAVTTSVAVSDLTSGTAIWQATDGTLTLSDKTGTSWLVADVDTEKPAAAVNYGNLTKADGVYSFTQTTALASITVDGVKVELPSDCSQIPITASGAVFTVTASDKFTVNATSTLPSISGVSAITLTSGTIPATADIPITALGNVITRTAGDGLTVTVDSSAVTVGALNTGDKFTVGATSYEMTAAGLLDTTNQKLLAEVTTSYTLGSDFTPIIAADGTTLDLSNRTEAAHVYDSLTSPTKKLAELTVADGVLTLTKTTDGIETIQLARNAALEIDFAATVEGSGTTTVNGATYAGTTTLYIDTTANDSTLQSGTITLSTANPSAQATNDTSALTVTSGTISAQATAGKFTTISGLATGESFSFGGKTYTQTAIGLTDGTSLNTAVTTSVAVSDLTSGTAIWQASGGALTLSDKTGTSWLVADVDTEKPTAAVNYGNLTKVDGVYSFTQTTALNSITVDGVKVELPADCSQIPITASGAVFTVTASGAFTVNATATLPSISGVSAINLTSGTIPATTDIPITALGNVITRTAGDGLTVQVSGSAVTIGALNTGDKFTVGTTSYEMTAAGLLDTTNQKLLAEVTTSYTLGSDFTPIIAADGTTLDLSNRTEAAHVYDSLTAPTKKLAELTVADGVLTLTKTTDGIKTIQLARNAALEIDFAALVEASGTTTVNGATYAGTTDLVIDTTAESSTLQSGTITLSTANPSVQATNDTSALTVTSGTISAQATAGKFTTISGLATGESFTFGGKTYTQTAIGLTDGTSLNTAVTTSVAVSDLTSGTSIWQASGGALTLSDKTGTSWLVADVDTEKPAAAVNYGTLTKTDGVYSFTQTTALASITVDGVKVELPADCSQIPITASGAEFTVTASGAFTVNATSTLPSIENVSAINLTRGTIPATTDIPITALGNVITRTAGDGLTVQVSGSAVTVGGLNTGDTFTVGTTSYEMTAAGLLDTTNQKLLAEVTTSYTLGSDFTPIIAVDGTTLDLSNRTEAAHVYDSLTSPTKKLAELTVADGVLTLTKTADGIKTIQLARNAALEIDFAALVEASGTTTVNGATYAGTTDLTIDTTANDSTLNSGTITLSTANPSAQATNDTSALTVTSGTISATATGGKFTTISGLATGESFTFGGKTYTQTAIGLTDGTSLNTAVTTSVAVSDLTSGTSIWQASGGALTLSDKTGASWLVADVDTENPAAAVNYGTLTKTDGVYSFTQTTALASITVDGVKVELPADCSQIPITASGAEFTVTASGAFTVNATSTLPSIENVSAITLTSGTIPATTDIPITALGNVITRTAGDGLTVQVSGSAVTIGGLNTGDTFTVGTTSYEMTAAGLLDVTNQKLLAEVTTSYTLGSDFTPIIAADGTTLDLSNRTEAAHVYDSLTSPTKKLAELTVADGVLTLTKTADGIKTIQLARNAALEIDFAALVEASGTTTVNGATYAGTTDLVIDTTAESSTLQSGTITLSTANPSVQATNDTSALTVTSGTISATATGGKFTTISGLATGESFSFGGKTYTQSNRGLITGSTISEELAGETLDLSKLPSAKFENFIGLSNRTLDLSDVTADSIVYDDDTSPTVKLASFTVNNKRITLSGGDTVTTAIDSVIISADTVLTVDFATQINSPSGTVTVNSKRYNGSSELIIDSDGTTSTLYRGTVILDTTNPTVTPTDDDATLQVERGTINATIFDGLFVTVSDLDPTDSFTFDGKTYTQTAVGLMFEDGTISERLAGTAIELSDLANVSWSNIIVPSNGTLDLTAATANALVLDDATNPSTKFATLTISNGELTLEGTANATAGISTVKVATGAVLAVDFTTQINAPSGSVTVNDKTFNGTTELTLDCDGNNVTLTSGTVSLAKGDDVTATSGNTITASDGDGLTVNVNGGTITISGLNVGDIFKVDNATYEVTTAGLHNTGGKLWTGGTNYSSGLTLDDLSNADNWSAVIEVRDGVLSIDSSSISNGEQAIVVDDASNPTEVLATLTKADDVYALTKNNGSLSVIEIDGVEIAIDRDFAGVPITTTNANGKESVFSVEPTNADTFTVDATGNAPTFDNVKTITITSGKIELAEGQKFTLAEGAADVSILTGNGTYDIGDETFTIAGLADDTRIEFTINDNGNTAEVIGFDKDATVTIDGTTYTAPQDSATLHYTDADGWYFEGFVYDEYTVTVHADGTITVNAGAKFTDVLSSGKTLDGSIQFAADLSKTPVTVINNGNTTFDIIDASGNTIAKNFVKNDGTIFNANGVEISSLADMAGTSFILQEGQRVQSDDATITAEIKDCEVGIGSKGESLSVDKSATIAVPENISLSLNAGDYTVNGVSFTASGTASATTNASGFEVDLETSDALTYDDMTLAGGTATLDNSGGVTLAGGVVATNTEDKTLTIKDTATLDDKEINTNMSVKLTSNYDGLTVGSKTFFVDGDTDGYKVNIAWGQVIGLENIGGSDGVTVGGIGNATIKTDTSGSFTVGNKTFDVEGNVTYRVRNDKVISIADATGTISGDFSGGVYINGEGVTIDGEASRVVIDESTVTKVLTDDDGSFTINDKSYEIIGDDSVAFNMSNSVVSGIESLESGTLVIANDEADFTINDTTIDLVGNSSPVTLGIVDSKINSVSGIDGTINGLEDATIYGMTTGVVNGKLIDVTTNSEFDVVVVDGTTSYINGVAGDAIINSAPSMMLTTAENGTFTFGTDEFIINDTLDASVDFLTDENSKVIGIDRFAGSISGGALDGLILNGDELKMDGDNLVIEADGEKITNLTGLEDGNEVALDLNGIDLAVPEGEVTINGTSYKLDGDEDGITLSDGEVITGLDRDATLTIGDDGVYSINGEPVTVHAGDALTVNREGIFKIDPDNPPITEKTNAADILKRSDNSIHIDEDETAAQAVDLTETEGDSIVLIDRQTDAPDTVKTGDGKDTVVVRHGAEVEVDLNDSGETLLIPTAGRVSLENYNGNNAAVQTYEYNNLAGAIKSNEILFGDGTMTLDGAVVVFDPNAEAVGSITANLLNASGERQAVGFTNTAGGEVDKSDATEDYILKGNYAEGSSDTQKSGGSTIKSGSGNDTMLAGAMDFVDAGTGKNQIYLTDKTLRDTDLEGATIVLNYDADDRTKNFITGFEKSSDKILVTNFEDVLFDYGADRLIMSIGGGQMILNSVNPEEKSYEVKFTDGTDDYNAMIAKNGYDIEVVDGSAANLFLGNLYSEGIDFSEYTSAIDVNLNDHSGAVNGSSAKFYGIDRVTAGAGTFSITGAADTPNTLIAGAGGGNIWSNSGNDLMKGNTSSDKGSTSFHFLANDGRDTITNFDFMSSASDYSTSDIIRLKGTTNVALNGSDVVIQINNSANDYLTLTEARGKAFRVNDDLIAKVDTNLKFDGLTNCYVAGGSDATLKIGKGMGNTNLWLSDTSISRHGTMFYGDFKEINALYANGSNTLAGNTSENLIIGGTGSNSIWGGAGKANDTLVGGAGRNEFFFCAGNGHDVISNAHSGDVVNMYEVTLDQVAKAKITSGGVAVELTDGSKLDIQSKDTIEYRLADGSAWTADHINKTWNKK